MCWELTHYELSTGEARVTVGSQLVGAQTHTVTAVSQLTGNEQADSTDQLELWRSERRTQLNQQAIDKVQSQWKHALVASLYLAYLHTHKITILLLRQNKQ